MMPSRCKVAFDMSDPTQAVRARYLHPKVGADTLSGLPEQDQSPMLSIVQIVGPESLAVTVSDRL